MSVGKGEGTLSVSFLIVSRGWLNLKRGGAGTQLRGEKRSVTKRKRGEAFITRWKNIERKTNRVEKLLKELDRAIGSQTVTIGKWTSQKYLGWGVGKENRGANVQ